MTTDNKSLLSKFYRIQPTLEMLDTAEKTSSPELFIIRNNCNLLITLEAQKFCIESDAMKSDVEKQLTMVSALKDHLWEIINTGHYSAVEMYYRQLFTCATFFKVFFQLILAAPDFDKKILDDCIWDIDNGFLLGHPLDKNPLLLTMCLELLQPLVVEDELSTNADSLLNSIEPKRDLTETSEDGISIFRRPSVEHFQINCFEKGIPAILTDCICHWPAIKLWRQPAYLLKLAGSRIVPIEIGQNYTTENWSQDLVKFRDFFQRQLLTDDTRNRIEYLAQHNLFEQIPELKKDIQIPEYCCISKRTDCDTDQLDIKAWLGPKGTVSPLHHDPKHNLLAQIFGHKRIILASPQDSIHLYPHDGDMLSNTSQVDVEAIDFEKFPLVKNARLYTITLYAGEVLYIPPKWWHHVRSLDKSFSVSFWWN